MLVDCGFLWVESCLAAGVQETQLNSALQNQFVHVCGDFLPVTKLTQEINLGKQVNTAAAQLVSARVFLFVS